MQLFIIFPWLTHNQYTKYCQLFIFIAVISEYSELWVLKLLNWILEFTIYQGISEQVIVQIFATYHLTDTEWERIKDPPEENKMTIQSFVFLCILTISLFATVFVLGAKQKLCHTDYVKSQHWKRSKCICL